MPHLRECLIATVDLHRETEYAVAVGYIEAIAVAAGNARDHRRGVVALGRHQGLAVLIGDLVAGPR